MSIERNAERGGVIAQSFATEAEAEGAIIGLRNAGFAGDDISVLARDPENSERVAAATGTEAPEGAAIGAATGGLLGGAGGLLVGLGALAIPGVGPLVAAGPIAAALAGIGIGGAAGGVIGALTGLGIPEEEATAYEERFRAGDIIVAVNTRGRKEEARRILQAQYTDMGTSSAGADAGPYSGDAVL